MVLFHGQPDKNLWVMFKSDKYRDCQLCQLVQKDDACRQYGPKTTQRFSEVLQVGCCSFHMTCSGMVNKDNCSACRHPRAINTTAAHSFDSCFHLSWFWGRDFGDSVAYRQSSSLVQDDYSQSVSISQAHVSHLQKHSCRLLKKAQA